MNILILGATGFIGSHIAAKLASDGHKVTGIGRDIARLNARMPQVTWLRADIATRLHASDWTDLLAKQDVVVNCAGALQDGLKDRLSDLQTRSQMALYAAAKTAGIKLIVQISAETSGPSGTTDFLATKRAADEALAKSGLAHVILRPALVIGRNGFGGTALIRALAAFPLILPLVHTSSVVATVTIDDVANAVSLAVTGDIASGSDLTLAGQSETLGGIVTRHRNWLGLPPAPIVGLPALVAAPVSWVADAIGWLGWRSPLRSTAMQVMSDGVNVRGPTTRAPFQLEDMTGFLARNPAGTQDIWFARLYLLKPLIFFCLSAFWIASGLIPLLDPTRAAHHLESLTDNTTAVALTFVTCAIDVFLGATVLFRPRARLALVGMMAVTLAYITGSLLIEPSIWLDPLGPMIKTLPALLLAVTGLAILDER